MNATTVAILLLRAFGWIGLVAGLLIGGGVLLQVWTSGEGVTGLSAITVALTYIFSAVLVWAVLTTLAYIAERMQPHP